MGDRDVGSTATALLDPLVDDPRFFILSNIVIWIVIGVVVGTVSFDQGTLRSAIPTAVGGVASGSFSDRRSSTTDTKLAMSGLDTLETARHDSCVSPVAPLDLTARLVTPEFRPLGLGRIE